MQHHRVWSVPARALGLSLVLGLCAVAPGAGCSRSGTGGTGARIEEAKAALGRGEFETAYRRAKDVEVESPESADAYEAFVIAAASFRVLYHRDRISRPDSVWVTSEPVFMFGWLAKYLGGDSRTEAANVFFVGLPYNVFREFENYGRARRDLPGWALRVEDDNGIIRSVAAEPFEAGAS